MGNSLHNKIYLGRRARGIKSKGTAVLFFLGALLGAGALWIALHMLR